MTSRFSKFTPSRRQVVKSLAAPASRCRRSSATTPRSPPIPTGRCKIVVANTPGGPSDIVAPHHRRRVAASRPARPSSIENNGGAGGNIGMGYAARAEADGYTLLLATNAYSVNAGLYNNCPTIRRRTSSPWPRSPSSPNTLRRAARPRRQDDEGVRRARESQSGEVQRLDAADRHHAATAGRGAQTRAKACRRCDVVFSGGGDALQAMLSAAPCNCAPARSRRRTRTSSPAR